MSWLKKVRVKYVLAGVGALYLLAVAGYLVYAASTRQQTPSGPSELEAHPERQAEILAKQRAEELQQRLGLTDEQTQKIAGLYASSEAKRAAQSGTSPGDFRSNWRSTQEEMAKILTPEQQAQMQQGMGQFRGRGGPGMMMNPEKIDSLRGKMTPEQRERFDKKMEQMQQRMQQGFGGRGSGGPQR